MNFAQTELLIHVVNRETNRILDVDRWVGPRTLTAGPPPCPGTGEGAHQQMHRQHHQSCRVAVGRATRENTGYEQSLPLCTLLSPSVKWEHYTDCENQTGSCMKGW